MIYNKENIQDLRDIIVTEQKNRKKVIWTNGCFDIMHPGHMRNFEACKEVADIVIVGLNGDASPYWKTKPGRPINNENFRAKMLTELKNVDFVYIFDDETPEKPVDFLKPDAILKGGDYILESKRDRIKKNGSILDLTNVYREIIAEGSEKYAHEKGYLEEGIVCASNGGSVYIVPIVSGYSTTNIVEKMDTTKMRQSKILVVGDVMLDRFDYGDVRRLNPESPNPLLNVTKEEFRLGGSANVAANILGLDEACDLVGMTGRDLHRDIFIRLCKEKSVRFFELLTNTPTITKQRFIENTYKQQLLRVDYEASVKLSEADETYVLNLVKDGNYEIIIISDYNKGMISEKLIKELKKSNIKILVDAKPKNVEFFRDVYLVKPNFKEFCQMIGNDIENTDEEIEKYGKAFAKEMNTNLVITRGNKGASIFTKDLEYFHIETKAKEAFDVTGAGDTFIATIGWALVGGYNLFDAVKLGNKASGIVIGKTGTEIIKKEELF
ncbi:hypothetical protein CSB09_03130 [Candidatus Gracilibacteria bacterium]|nr:MAG: hypothetical protein CSB09_03130 [Candidatus Gracilibacteria bacterium]